MYYEYVDLIGAAKALKNGMKIQYESGAIWYDVKDNLPVSQNPEHDIKYRIKLDAFEKGWYEYEGVMGGMAYYTGESWVSLEWYGLPDIMKLGRRIEL